MGFPDCAAASGYHLVHHLERGLQSPHCESTIRPRLTYAIGAYPDSRIRTVQGISRLDLAVFRPDAGLGDGGGRKILGFGRDLAVVLGLGPVFLDLRAPGRLPLPAEVTHRRALLLLFELPSGEQQPVEAEVRFGEVQTSASVARRQRGYQAPKHLAVRSAAVPPLETNRLRHSVGTAVSGSARRGADGKMAGTQRVTLQVRIGQGCRSPEVDLCSWTRGDRLRQMVRAGADVGGLGMP